MTEAQARYIWQVLFEISGQKNVVVEVRLADSKKKAVA